MPRKNRAVLNISLEVKSELDTIKASGQSYNGVIRDLVKFWKEERGQYWTRRRVAKDKEKGNQ